MTTVSRTNDASRDLLFGLLALQNGLIDQGQLVAGFQAWARQKMRPLAELLVARGDLDGEQRAGIEAMVALHVKKHGGDTEKSLASVPADVVARLGLARTGDAEIDASLGNIGFSTVHAGDDADRTSSLGVSTSLGERFQILRPHARGGLGAVLVARDQELHREVALKQILAEFADDPTSRQRFLLEAEITGGLEHPGIVPVYGLGIDAGGRPFYAMRFIRGESLKTAIAGYHVDASLKPDAGRRSLALRQLLRRFVDVCHAIDYAHSRGVLHRDLKPANIIVGKHGETLVVDWGLAKAVGRSEPRNVTDERTLVPSSGSAPRGTLPGSAMGTPGYMSPEQASGDLEHLGPRSDVYSLGATLYCLLTGRPPFEGEDVGSILRAVQRGEFSPPSAREASIDRALEAVCLKAMALAPDDRYATPKELSDDVERWQADEPVTVWREPFTRRARRWARQNRLLVTAALGAVLVAVAGLVAGLAVQTRANVLLRNANIDQAIANAKVTATNAELQAANERERQRFDLAVEAIRRYHTDVSEDFLLKQDQFKELRDRLLRDAVAFYRKLEGLLAGQSDSRSRRALGRAYEEVGELTEKIGSIPEALATHRKALDLRRMLAREAGSDSATKADVGRSLTAIAFMQYRTGRYSEALTTFAEARSILDGLSGEGPDRDPILGDLARNLFWTGITYRRKGQTREAMAAFQQSREIEEQLTAAHPDVVDYQRILSWCYNDIALICDAEGKEPASLRAYEESLRIKQTIANDHPNVAEYQRDLAMSHHNIGIMLLLSGRPAEALASHQAALAIRSALAGAQPAVTQFQKDLANGLNETGDALRVLGSTGDAQKSYERAREILKGLIEKNPDITENQVFLVQCLRGLGATERGAGRTANAVSTWRQAIAIGERLESSDGEPLYYLAGCHAQLGRVASAPGAEISAQEGKSELDRAMDTLRRAVAAGYHPVKWMRRDPDLGPLRDREDFELLIEDLEFPAEPFASTD
jgi:eukaryotic-like serine/threonine-protein kinase